MAIASGNWGCGAFGGDPQLKSLIQLMAAAECGRQLAYFTFGDTRLRDELASLHELLVESKVEVGALFNMICGYSKVAQGYAGKPKMGLFEYVREMVSSYGIDTDNEMDDGDVEMTDAPPLRNGAEREVEAKEEDHQVESVVGASAAKEDSEVQNNPIADWEGDGSGVDNRDNSVDGAVEDDRDMRKIGDSEALKRSDDHAQKNIKVSSVQSEEPRRSSTPSGFAKMEASTQDRHCHSSPSPKRGKNSASNGDSSPRRRSSRGNHLQPKITEHFPPK